MNDYQPEDCYWKFKDRNYCGCPFSGPYMNTYHDSLMVMPNRDDLKRHREFVIIKINDIKDTLNMILDNCKREGIE